MVRCVARVGWRHAQLDAASCGSLSLTYSVHRGPAGLPGPSRSDRRVGVVWRGSDLRLSATFVFLPASIESKNERCDPRLAGWPDLTPGWPDPRLADPEREGDGTATPLAPPGDPLHRTGSGARTPTNSTTRAIATASNRQEHAKPTIRASVRARPPDTRIG